MRRLTTTIGLAAVVGTTAAAAAPAAPIAPDRIVSAAPPVTDSPAEPPEAEEARTVQLGLPAPERLPPATPERALAELLQAWHDRAWDRMAVWAAVPAAELRRRYGADRLRGWAIVSRRVSHGAARFDVVTSVRGMRPLLTRETETFLAVKGLRGRWRLQSVARGILEPLA
jgi:hypothetical protein